MLYTKKGFKKHIHISSCFIVQNAFLENFQNHLLPIIRPESPMYSVGNGCLDPAGLAAPRRKTEIEVTYAGNDVSN